MSDEMSQKSVFKDESTQQMLNDPVKQESFRDNKNQALLNDILSQIEDAKINLYTPSSLLNKSVYDSLSEEIQGKVDLEAMNLLSVIRDIKGLSDRGDKGSYQMENMVERVRNTKERIENESGDVFVI